MTKRYDLQVAIGNLLHAAVACWSNQGGTAAQREKKRAAANAIFDLFEDSRPVPSPDLFPIAQRWRAATPGPWEWYEVADGKTLVLHGHPDVIMAEVLVCAEQCNTCVSAGKPCTWPRPEDRAFIEHAHADIRALLDEIAKHTAPRLKQGVDDV